MSASSLKKSENQTELQPMKRSLSKEEHHDAMFHFISGLMDEIHQPLEQVRQRARRLVQQYENREFEYITYREFRDILQTLSRMDHELGRCCDTSERMVSLASRDQRMNKQTSSVSRVVKEVFDIMDIRFDVANIKTTMKMPKRLPEVCMSQVDFNVVVRHICDNAIQAMPSGGTLIVRAVEHKAEGIVEVSFRDEGVGITKKNIDRIFEPFFTTKERGLDKNSGLGLSIVYSLVKQNKGDVSIESSTRKGTTVRVHLPVKGVKAKSS